jgi:hypothetical protein
MLNPCIGSTTLPVHFLLAVVKARLKYARLELLFLESSCA